MPRPNQLQGEYVKAKLFVDPSQQGVDVKSKGNDMLSMKGQSAFVRMNTCDVSNPFTTDSNIPAPITDGTGVFEYEQ